MKKKEASKRSLGKSLPWPRNLKGRTEAREDRMGLSQAAGELRYCFLLVSNRIASASGAFNEGSCCKEAACFIFWLLIHKIITQKLY